MDEDEVLSQAINQEVTSSKDNITIVYTVGEVGPSDDGTYDCTFDFGESGIMRNPVKLDLIGNNEVFI